MMNALSEIQDDLTTMSRNAVTKTMRREGHDLGDDFANLTVDELRENHREWRRAHGLDGGVIDAAKPAMANVETKATWKLTIPVVAIRSLGRDAFIGAIRYRDLDKIDVDADVQRPESKRRIPEIARYVAEGNGYFGAAMITVSGAAEGKAMLDDNTLIIEEGARVVVNDGQHRLAGVKSAMTRSDWDAERNDDSLPVVIYADLSKEEQRQLFNDINANAKKPPRAIMDAYDERDMLRRFAHDIVKTSSVFNGKTNFLKTRISAKDSQQFTFSNVVDACGEMFDDLSPETYDERLGDAGEFWSQVDAVLGQAWEAKTFANTKNALVAIARLHGFNVDWAKLGALDWSSDGELARVAGDAGGTNAAVKALSEELQRQVVTDEEA